MMLSGMLSCFFFQAEDGIRDLVRSRGLGDVYKRQYEGSIVYDGKELNLGVGAIRQARDEGIAIVYQELTLVPNMTVGENVFLGKEPVLSLIHI